MEKQGSKDNTQAQPQALANQLANGETLSLAAPFYDLRSQTVLQGKWQQLIQQSPRVKQLQAYQDMATRGLMQRRSVIQRVKGKADAEAVFMQYKGAKMPIPRLVRLTWNKLKGICEGDGTDMDSLSVEEAVAKLHADDQADADERKAKAEASIAAKKKQAEEHKGAPLMHAPEAFELGEDWLKIEIPTQLGTATLRLKQAQQPVARMLVVFAHGRQGDAPVRLIPEGGPGWDFAFVVPKGNAMSRRFVEAGTIAALTSSFGKMMNAGSGLYRAAAVPNLYVGEHFGNEIKELYDMANAAAMYCDVAFLTDLRLDRAKEDESNAAIFHDEKIPLEMLLTSKVGGHTLLDRYGHFLMATCRSPWPAGASKGESPPEKLYNANDSEEDIVPSFSPEQLANLEVIDLTGVLLSAGATNIIIESIEQGKLPKLRQLKIEARSISPDMRGRAMSRGVEVEIINP
ncbi:MAG: hypothetical protein AAF985_19770 [Bacteroidota bacterium]